MAKDDFLTIDTIYEAIYKDKGSKFLSFAHPIKSIEQVKQILSTYKKDSRFKGACHFCFAYCCSRIDLLSRLTTVLTQDVLLAGAVVGLFHASDHVREWALDVLRTKFVSALRLQTGIGRINRSVLFSTVSVFWIRPISNPQC